jgi:drug/metabolite transporter (DMT)-like permease
MNDNAKAYACCALAMLLVGSTVVASKVIAAGLPPFTATALRFAIALPLFLLLLRAKGQQLPSLSRTSARDRWLLLAQAAAGSVGYTVLMISGLRLAPATDAGVIAGTLPAVAALFAVLVLGERPTLRLWLAIALACLGVMVVNLRDRGDPIAGPGQGLGSLLIFGAVVCEALFILLNKKLQQPLHALALSTLMCGGGLLIALPFALIELGGMPINSAQLLPALLGVVHYALLPTVLGFLLWYTGSARIPSAHAGLLTALLPVSALLFAAWLLGEAISHQQLLGMCCVLGAMGMMSISADAKSPVGAKSVTP